MELTFSKINGTNTDLNYDLLKESIIEKLKVTCKKAEVIILNNFPVSVYSQANIDLLVLIRIPKIHNNYYRIKTENDSVYLHNALIAISIVNEYQNQKIELQNSELTVNNMLFDFSDIAIKLKWSLTNYLSEACNFQRNRITVHPIFWIKNNHYNDVDTYLIGSENLTFELLEKCISKNDYVKYSGYAGWNQYELNFDNDVRNLFEQASKDSELGYLTKNKIDRIQNKFTDALQKAYDSIGKQLVEIKGKAGTGKSSDLLKMMLNFSKLGKRATFLTYNHLLVFDLTRQIKSFENALTDEERSEKGSTTTYTLHKFFYNLAKKLGVLTLMSEQRIVELISILENRLEKIEKYFEGVNASEPEISLAKLKMYIQNKVDFDEGLKREALDFLKYLNDEKYRRLQGNDLLKIWIESFKRKKIMQVSALQNSQVFLRDYHKVLERILQALNNLDGYISDFDITNKSNLMAPVFGYKRNESLLIEDALENKYDLEKLKTTFRKSIGGFKGGRLLFVDEAQDCHRFEKEILFTIFGYDNIIIANGGKEQLIRYSEICDWDVHNNQRVLKYSYSKRPRSFRMKPAIAKLVNHVAKTFNINVDIIPEETEDHGHIIIDKKYGIDIQQKIDAIKYLDTFGKRQGCTSYESLLLLCPSDITNKNKETDNVSDIDEIEDSKNITINEFNVIKEDSNTLKEDWPIIKEASKQIGEFQFWNTTGNVDKRKQSVPGSLSVRSIYYESCRGIEAWSVMCFALDHFFKNKRQEDEADNYLLNDMFYQLEPEKRKDMYAATWVLMALTRAIDTCYIELEDLESSLSKTILEFVEQNPNYILTID